jgi:hypothetical protein
MLVLEQEQMLEQKKDWLLVLDLLVVVLVWLFVKKKIRSKNKYEKKNNKIQVKKIIAINEN